MGRKLTYKNLELLIYFCEHSKTARSFIHSCSLLFIQCGVSELP